MANQEKVTLLAVGDVSMHHRRGTSTTGMDPGALFVLCAPILRAADIAFCQLEDILSDRVNSTWNWPVSKYPAEEAKALADAGFNVISTAGNHHMNAGPDAFVDTLNFLKENNILPVGVGMNIAEARAPAIIERKGVRVAFLGYSSVMPRGELPWEARLNKPGCAPMFINTFYDQMDYQPGTPPRIITFAEKQNLVEMEEDIRRAKAQADVVIMSIHWGLHHISALIPMYEYEVGHAAIDAGVDIILGHGPHRVKGIEVYKGKVIFHSLGNFAFSTGDPKPGTRGYWEDMRAPLPRESGFSQYPAPPSSIFTQSKELRSSEEKFSMIAKCIISGKKIKRVSFQPCMINKAEQSEPLSREDKRSDETYQNVEWACKEAGMDTRFSREGDEVVVLT